MENNIQQLIEHTQKTALDYNQPLYGLLRIISLESPDDQDFGSKVRDVIRNIENIHRAEVEESMDKQLQAIINKF